MLSIYSADNGMSADLCRGSAAGVSGEGPRIGIVARPGLGGATVSGSTTRGDAASGVLIVTSEANPATGVAATLAPAGAGRGSGIFGRARGSGTRRKESLRASATVSGRSGFWVSGQTSCDHAGMAVPASTSAPRTVVRPDLINASLLHLNSHISQLILVNPPRINVRQ
jgi:hypothetical protein